MKRWAVRLAVGVWLAVSLASLGAMFQLWWGRERVLYAGKSPDEQRAAVVARAGISAQTLELARQADDAWPLAATYDAEGSEVSLSYFKYLELPRIPSGFGICRIEEQGDEIALTPATGQVPDHPSFQTVAPTPRGLVLSALVLLGLAAGLSRFGFSLPEGMACAALVLCAFTVLLKPVFHAYAPIGILMCGLGVAGAGLAWTGRRGRAGAGVRAAAAAGAWEKGMQWGALAVLAGALLWALLMAVVVVPDDWDAWAQWGPKAKILALSTGALGDVKYFVPGSGDYPLLWPSVWAFSGWCAGGWEEQWSKGWGVLFFALTAWQLQRVVMRESGHAVAGWVAAALFASMPAVPLVASWGYAEAPLWLMLVCGMSRLLRWRTTGARPDLWKAGCFLAAAACTKNEGLLFAVLGVAWVALCSRKIRDVAAAGLLPLGCAVAWKVYVDFGMGATNHVVDSLLAESLGWAGWIDRVGTLGGYIVRQWVDVRQWNLVLPGAVVMAAWLAARGRCEDRMNLLVPLGMLGGLGAVVVLHGDNWLWQLYVVWNRLTIQFFVLLLPVLAVGFGRGECACPKGRLAQE